MFALTNAARTLYFSQITKRKGDVDVSAVRDPKHARTFPSREEAQRYYDTHKTRSHMMAEFSNVVILSEIWEVVG